MVNVLNKPNHGGSLTLFLEDEQYPNHSNQVSFRLNYLQHLLKQQAFINEHLSDQNKNLENRLSASYNEMNHHVHDFSTKQNRHYEDVLQHVHAQDELLAKLFLLTEKQVQSNAIILERLASLERSNHSIMKVMKDGSSTQNEMLNQLNYQEASTQALNRKMDVLESFSESLTEKMNDQEVLIGEMENKMEVQEIFHSTVMERLDKQEALTDKILRQLDNLKGAIFERSAYLSEKFEASIKVLAKPVQSFFVKHANDKKEEQNKIQK